MIKLVRSTLIYLLFCLACGRVEAQNDPFVACRLRLPADAAGELSEKSEQERQEWLAANCNEVNLTYLECRERLTPKQRGDYALVPDHLKRSWLRTQCQIPETVGPPTYPDAGPPPRRLVAMVGASGGRRFSDDDRKQLHEVVRLVIADALAPRQIQVMAAQQITDAPCDRMARQETAQATNATTVMCFHSMLQGQDTVIGLALYDASNDRVIRSVVLPVAGAHARDIAYPLQAAAKDLVSGNDSPSNLQPGFSMGSDYAGRFQERPRLWLAQRVTGGVLFGVGLASLTSGLWLAGLFESEKPATWVPFVVAGGAFTLVGGALLARSEFHKRRSMGFALVPIRSGVATAWSYSF